MMGPKAIVGRALRPKRIVVVIATLLLAGHAGGRPLAAELDSTDVLQGEEVAVRECGRCHQLELTALGVVGREAFRDHVRHADWDSLPLRSWLDIRHRPRVPVVDLSEADVDALGAYLEWLGQDFSPVLEVEEIEPAPKTAPGKPQVAIPQELLEVPPGAAVKPPRCVNCYPASPDPLNRP
jgi:hypothetical protein